MLEAYNKCKTNRQVIYSVFRFNPNYFNARYLDQRVFNVFYKQ